MKTAAKILAGAVVAAVLGWLGTYVTWHVRIQGAIRKLDGPASLDETSRARDVLAGAGCRSLPYLIRAIDPERDQRWLWQIIRERAVEVAASGPMETFTDVRFSDSLDLLDEHVLHPGSTAAKRRESRAGLDAWWKSEGPRFHQWWRVWSSNCAR